MDYYDLYDITPEEEAAMEADRERDLSQSTALRDVADERDRQRLVKGWTTEHDDEHTDGEMATAAACYAAYSASSMSLHEVTALWPWGQKWWKPSNPRRDLVKAAALIVAEIERLDRASHSAPWPHGDAPSSILETVEEARKPDLNRRSVTSQASEGEVADAGTIREHESTDEAMWRATILKDRGYHYLAASERLEQEAYDRAAKRGEHTGTDGI